MEECKQRGARDGAGGGQTTENILGESLRLVPFCTLISFASESNCTFISHLSGQIKSLAAVIDADQRRFSQAHNVPPCNVKNVKKANLPPNKLFHGP